MRNNIKRKTKNNNKNRQLVRDPDVTLLTFTVKVITGSKCPSTCSLLAILPHACTELPSDSQPLCARTDGFLRDLFPTSRLNHFLSFYFCGGKKNKQKPQTISGFRRRRVEGPEKAALGRRSAGGLMAGRSSQVAAAVCHLTLRHFLICCLLLRGLVSLRQ